MKGILTCIDLKENSVKTIQCAGNLAKIWNENLSILHVYDSLMLPTDPYETINESQFRDQALEQMKYFVNAAEMDELVNRTFLRSGATGSEIVNLVEEHEFSMVVIGKHHHSDTAFLQTSPVDHVIQHCPIPVITIPDGYTFAPPTSVVHATDLMGDDTMIVKKLLEISTHFKASLRIIHLVEQKGQLTEAEEKLKALTAQFPHNDIHGETILMDNVEEGIINAIYPWESCMLSLTTHTKSTLVNLFHRSLTKKISAQTNIPTIIFNQPLYERIFI